MLRPLLRNRAVLGVARVRHAACVCFTIFNVVIAAWHLPALYNLAMANHNVHIVEHLMFMAAAVLMWWPFMSPLPELPRLAYPGQMLYCFLVSIPMSVDRGLHRAGRSRAVSGVRSRRRGSGASRRCRIR